MVLSDHMEKAKYYEISYLLAPTLREEDAVVHEEEIRSLLSMHEANLESWDSPRRRNLAFPIGDQREAYMGAIRFTAHTSKAPEIRESLAKKKNVLRSILVEWQKTPIRRKPPIERKHEPTAAEMPTDIKALDEKLEEILGQ
jgi:ribosomal protein S6